MKTFRRLVIHCLALAAMSTAAAAGDEPSGTLYSFADLYRLTVGGALAPDEGLRANAEPQIRLAAFEPVAAAEPRFTITPVSHPGTGLLLLAGLAAAGWVAHRRLTYAY
jgi:hypothetical protein